MFMLFFIWKCTKFGHTTISNVHVNKVLLVTFAICCCAIIRNVFINLLRSHEHVYGHYWPIWEKKAIRIKTVIFYCYIN